jgi:hypothetical protein
MKKILIALLAFLSVAAPVRSAEENAGAPSPSLAKDSRCFELRTYYAAPGKLEALHARFRNHTNKLFVKHGMELVGYWVPQDRDKGAENKLIYILAHKDRDAAKKSWAGFVSDPEWKKAQSESEANGKLVEKAESVFMIATDYSPMK